MPGGSHGVIISAAHDRHPVEPVNTEYDRPRRQSNSKRDYVQSAVQEHGARDCGAQSPAQGGIPISSPSFRPARETRPSLSTIPCRSVRAWLLLASPRVQTSHNACKQRRTLGGKIQAYNGKGSASVPKTGTVWMDNSNNLGMQNGSGDKRPDLNVDRHRTSGS